MVCGGVWYLQMHRISISPHKHGRLIFKYGMITDTDFNVYNDQSCNMFCGI